MVVAAILAEVVFRLACANGLNFIENVPTRADGLLTEESLVGAAVLSFPAAAGPAPGVAVAAGPTSTPGTCMRGVCVGGLGE